MGIMRSSDATTLSSPGDRPGTAGVPDEFVPVPPGWRRQSWVLYLEHMANACRDKHPRRAAEFESAARRVETLTT